MGGVPLHVAEAVQDHMDGIKYFWKPGAKITVTVRVPGDDEGRMDFCMTDDDPTEVIKMLERRIAAERARIGETP